MNPFVAGVLLIPHPIVGVQQAGNPNPSSCALLANQCMCWLPHKTVVINAAPTNDGASRSDCCALAGTKAGSRGTRDTGGNEKSDFVSLRQSTKTILGQIAKYMSLRLCVLCFAFLCF